MRFLERCLPCLSTPQKARTGSSHGKKKKAGDKSMFGLRKKNKFPLWVMRRMKPSEQLDWWIAGTCMQRLLENTNDSTTLVVLDELASRSPHIISFLVPQLCTILQVYRNEKLQILVLDQCCRSLDVALVAYWYVSSICDGVRADAMLELLAKIQTAAVSARNPSKISVVSATTPSSPVSSSPISPRTPTTPQNVPDSPSHLPPAPPVMHLGPPASSAMANSNLLDSISARVAAMYLVAELFESELWLMDCLCDIATRLLDYPPPSRRDEATRELSELNEKLTEFQTRLGLLSLYVPLVGSNQYHHQLLRFVPENTIVFNTKKRAPLLVCFEVIESTDTKDSNSRKRGGLTSAHNVDELADGLLLASSMRLSSRDPGSPRTPPALVSSGLSPIESPPSPLVLDTPYHIANSPPLSQEQSPPTTASTNGAQIHQYQLHPVHQIPLPPGLSYTEPDKILNHVFGTTWEERKTARQQSSPFGDQIGWNIHAMIVKVNDDLRQEYLAYQLLAHMQRSFETSQLPIRMIPYRVMVTGVGSGLVEYIPDSTSLDSLKKKLPNIRLREFFELVYGPPSSSRFAIAQMNFITSLAGYCIACYILNVKDRHNGNILLTRDGSLVHIDFGFILGVSPGGSLKPVGGWETAPFKLTREFIDVIGGTDGPGFQLFQQLCVDAFLSIRKDAARILTLVHTMALTGNLPCFTAPDTLSSIHQRFHRTLSRTQCAAMVYGLIKQSTESWSTHTYDQFQQLTNNIRM